MDRTVGGPLIPTVPLNNVLNQETVVQDSHLHTRMPAVIAHLAKLQCVHMFVGYCGLLVCMHLSMIVSLYREY